MTHSDSTNTPTIWLHKGSKKWCLTRKGRRYYLGNTEDEAIERYNRYRQSIESGLQIPKLGEDLLEGQSVGAPTIKNLFGIFLASQKQRVDMNDLSTRSYNDYVNTGKRFCEFVGGSLLLSNLTVDHFSAYRSDVASRRNIVSTGNEVTRVKTIFKTLFEDGKIESLPRFGKHFRRPDKSEVREYKFNRGRKDLERNECLLLITELGVHERAMSLLGLNAGFGNTDVSRLPIKHVDLDGAIIQTIRPKTKEFRVATLWPETVEALRLSLRFRNTPVSEDDAECFFVTFAGNRYVSEFGSAGKAANDLINVRVRAAMQRLGIHKPGRNFYSLRHTFRTIAEQVGDDKASAWAMGHVRDGQPEDYIHEAPVERIKKVTDYVRSWLFDQ